MRGLSQAVRKTGIRKSCSYDKEELLRFFVVVQRHLWLVLFLQKESHMRLQELDWLYLKQQSIVMKRYMSVGLKERPRVPSFVGWRDNDDIS